MEGEDEDLNMLASSLNLEHILNISNLHHHDNLVDQAHGHASCVSINENAYCHGHSNNVHVMYDDESFKHKFASPVSGFSLKSDGSSSSFLSAGVDESNLVDHFNLPVNFSKMYISSEPESVSVSDRANGTRFERYGAYDSYVKGFSDCGGLFNPSVNLLFRRSHYNEENLIRLPNGRNKGPLRVRVPHTETRYLFQARGRVHSMAKDQDGCRFLQRMLDEGASLDVVEMIFEEIIDHAVELMMNPFGNYLMQKLLEVCGEERRMRVLLRVTEEPGEIIRISLSTHGTRVVQKLIETLKTKQQVSLVISALEPGFLALIKDLNGNHVIQRCLQCFPSEDSKFILVAVAKYCVDIATHQHGCCVLQRCINHSTGEHREKLVEEISANGLLLAQDAFGNYVIQFILELRIPTAMSKLTSQFEGNYANLSTQKFSSHVVEKCLVVCDDEARSKIIHELISATCFGQLLQDPHANYVVQTALCVSKNQCHLHNSLVEAILSHKAISQNSPYSKRIFSHKLLKRW